MTGDPDRISESDLVMPTLRLAAAQPDGFIATSDLIAALHDLFEPSGTDAEILAGRSDTHFSQKVRNMISHRRGGNGFIANGFADYDDERRGIRITDAGRALLGKLNG